MLGRIVAARTLALAAFIASGAGAQTPPNLAGRWQLDTAATTLSGGGRGDGSGRASGGGGGGGGGIGLGPPAASLTIQQDDAAITILESGADTVPVRYRLNGKRTSNKLVVGRGMVADFAFTSRWKDGRLSTTMVRTITARGRTTRVRYHELIYRAADGALVIETTVEGRPDGRKAVYRASGERPL